MSYALKWYYQNQYDFTSILKVMGKYPAHFTWVGTYYFSYLPFISSKANLNKFLDT
jgi:hypothetical protein